MCSFFYFVFRRECLGTGGRGSATFELLNLSSCVCLSFGCACLCLRVCLSVRVCLESLIVRKFSGVQRASAKKVNAWLCVSVSVSVSLWVSQCVSVCQCECACGCLSVLCFRAWVVCVYTGRRGRGEGERRGGGNSLARQFGLCAVACWFDRFLVFETLVTFCFADRDFVVSHWWLCLGRRVQCMIVCSSMVCGGCQCLFVWCWCLRVCAVRVRLFVSVCGLFVLVCSSFCVYLSFAAFVAVIAMAFAVFVHVVVCVRGVWGLRSFLSFVIFVCRDFVFRDLIPCLFRSCCVFWTSWVQRGLKTFEFLNNQFSCHSFSPVASNSSTSRTMKKILKCQNDTTKKKEWKK